MEIEDKYSAQERQEKENCEHKYSSHTVGMNYQSYKCITCGKDFLKYKPERIEEIIECDPHDLSYHSLTHQTQVVRKINEIINKLNNL